MDSKKHSKNSFFEIEKEYYLCTRYVERFEIDCNHRKKMLKQSCFFASGSIQTSRSPKIIIKRAEF
jgi:hypothetical protein